MRLKKNLALKCLMVAAFLPSVALANDKENAKNAKKERKEVVANEVAQRSELLESLWKTRTKIKELEDAKNYVDAEIYYKELMNQLSSLKGTLAKEKLELLKKEYYDMHTAWIDSVVENAKALAKAKEYEEAKVVISAITSIDEERGGVIAKEYIQQWQKIIDGKNYRVVSDIKDPDWQKYPVVENLRLSADEQTKIKNSMLSAEEALALEDYDRAAAEVTEILTLDINNTRAQKILEKTYTPRINHLLLEAETYMKNNHYDEAIKCLEKIYIMDPFNIKASTMLSRAYNRVYSYAKARHRTDIEKLMADAEWNWVDPIKIESENAVKEIKAEVKLDKNPLMEEMEKIIFPKFEVADMNVIDIIHELGRRGKIYNNGKAIDMILKVVDGNPKFSKKSSFAFSNMPLSEILRYITLNFGLKYKFDGSTVVIGDGIENMILRSFTVRDDLIAAMMNDDLVAASAVEEESEDMVPEDGDMAEESAAPAGGGRIQAQSNQIMNYFRARGIEFPAGSRAFYTPRTTKLSIYNTEENLRKLSELIEQLMIIETPMVMTDVKILQITESQFEELGFEWDFSLAHKDWGVSSSTSGALLPEEKTVRTGGSGISDTERDTALIKNIDIFPKLDNKVFGATPNLKLTVYALSENGRAEILSTPRLISQSGNEARIQLTTETYYPDSWEEPEIEGSDSGTITMTGPVPEVSDEAMAEGITLIVRPEVSPDNRTINLFVNPKINSYVVESPDSTYYWQIKKEAIGANGTTTPLPTAVVPIWMPEEHVKSFTAKLKVYDGETIMVGGVMQNETNRRLDKMPLLGNIPLIGRLFQNRAEDTSKTNFLIFITARLINHTGRPVNPIINTATPTFNY